MLIVSTRQPIGVNATRTAVTDKIIASRELIAFNKILDATRPILRVNFDEISVETQTLLSRYSLERRLFVAFKKMKRKKKEKEEEWFENDFQTNS